MGWGGRLRRGFGDGLGGDNARCGGTGDGGGDLGSGEEKEFFLKQDELEHRRSFKKGLPPALNSGEGPGRTGRKKERTHGRHDSTVRRRRRRCPGSQEAR